MNIQRVFKNEALRTGMLAGLLCTVLSAVAQVTPETTEVPWNQRSWEDRVFKGKYEDFFTFKHGKTYFSDPFVWAYSQEFADKFRMPQEWVDPELQGALAVAWRMTTIGQTMCGYGGRAESCWPPLTCQMDIYFDNASPLPWRYDDIERASLMRGLSSTDHLPWLSPDSPSARFLNGGSKKAPLGNTALAYLGAKKTTTSGFSIIYFDRQIEPGITLLGFKETCPAIGPDAAAELKFFSEQEQRRTRGLIENYAHRVIFSSAFMKKIASIYAEKNQPNENKIQDLLKNFNNSKNKQ